MERDQYGYIILNDFDKVELNIKGRKQKFWLQKGDKKYLFKQGASNYEIWAELIAEEIGKQCGLNMAHYDLGIYHNQLGLISESFLKSNEKIYSGDVLIKASKEISKENNEAYVYDDSVESMINILSNFYNFSLSNDIFLKLSKLWLFDGIIMESDRNSTNWGFISKGNELDLAPIYDCSTMARLNNNISDFISAMRKGISIESFTNDIQHSLKFFSQFEGNFLSEFSIWCNKYYRISKKIVEPFFCIDVDKAISTLETRLNEGKKDTENLLQVPYECSFWLKKSIENRLDTIKFIYNDIRNNKIENNQKNEKSK